MLICSLYITTMEYFVVDAAAFGDLKKGPGTLGVTPPEAVLEKRMRCRPEQDVFAMGHLVLLMVTKQRYESHNMFLNRVSALCVLSRYRIYVGSTR